MEGDTEAAAAQLQTRLERKYGSLSTLRRERDDGVPRLFPVATARAVSDAEAGLGFDLPPLLKAIYRRIGNGGSALGLIGVRGGSPGFLLYPGLDLVAVYRRNCRETLDHFGVPWPERVVPIYDGLGCGVVRCVDCSTPAGQVLIWDYARVDFDAPAEQQVRMGLTQEWPTLAHLFGVAGVRKTGPGR
jgi:hypothetical protein